MRAAGAHRRRSGMHVRPHSAGIGVWLVLAAVIAAGAGTHKSEEVDSGSSPALAPVSTDGHRTIAQVRKGGRWRKPGSVNRAADIARRRARRGNQTRIRVRRASYISGEASWYGEAFRGREMACGGPFDPDKLTTAHPSLPCGTKLWVKGNGRAVRVTVTDRGPFAGGRILDLSRAAFKKLANPDRGTLPVTAYRGW